MADEKISELPAVVTAAGTDQAPVEQSGTTKRITLNQIKGFTLATGVTTGSFTMVTNLNKSGTMLQKKSVTVTVAAGLVTNISAETDWVDVGEFGGY